MFLCDQWRDYEVLDTGDGEKLERWGGIVLRRPDPQVIWNTPKTDKHWKQMNGHYHRRPRPVGRGAGHLHAQRHRRRALGVP